MILIKGSFEMFIIVYFTAKPDELNTLWAVIEAGACWWVFSGKLYCVYCAVLCYYCNKLWTFSKTYADELNAGEYDYDDVSGNWLN